MYCCAMGVVGCRDGAAIMCDSVVGSLEEADVDGSLDVTDNVVGGLMRGLGLHGDDNEDDDLTETRAIPLLLLAGWIEMLWSWNLIKGAVE